MERSGIFCLFEGGRFNLKLAPCRSCSWETPIGRFATAVPLHRSAAMGTTESWRRRTLIVHDRAQKRIILAVAFFPSLSLAMAAMIIAVFCRKLLGEAARVEADLPSLVPLFLSVLGFVLVSGIIIFHQALRFSNKVSGPCHRLMVGFDQIKSGDLGCKIGLRDGDHLVEVADAFNEFVDWLKEHPPQGLTSGDSAAVDGEATAGEATAETSPASRA